MFEKLKARLFGRKEPPQRRFSDEQYKLHYELKKRAMENILGEMHDLMRHSIVPLHQGGIVNLYYFPNAIEGTGFATMELIEPDGSGPQPSRIGTYELLAFTRRKLNDGDAFKQIEPRLHYILTGLALYSYEAELNPYDTIEWPPLKGQPPMYLILDNYTKPGADFVIGDIAHGLLLVIEVFRSEMTHAMAHGSEVVLSKLKDHGHYPYSDLDREPVIWFAVITPPCDTAFSEASVSAPPILR